MSNGKERVCINPKCHKPLPSNYRAPLCKNCRSRLAESGEKVIKAGGKVLLFSAAVIPAVANIFNENSDEQSDES